MDGIYRTRSQGLTALLRYLHGRDTHLRTYRGETGSVTFELRDPNNEAPGISQMYHGDAGGGGFGITDAKALIEEFCEVRRTMTATIGADAEWRNQQ